MTVIIVFTIVLSLLIAGLFGAFLASVCSGEDRCLATSRVYVVFGVLVLIAIVMAVVGSWAFVGAQLVHRMLR